MGWRIVSPGRWALFHDHPTKPGARWEKNDAGVFTAVYNKTGPRMTRLEITSRARQLPIGPQAIVMAACVNYSSMPLVDKVNFRMDPRHRTAARAIGAARNEMLERLYDEFDIDSGLLLNETQLNLAMFRFTNGADYEIDDA
jgi:hypothetical protein